MIEVLFVLVIIFVAYVFCCALSNTPTTTTAQVETLIETAIETPVIEQIAPEPEPEKKPEKPLKPATKSKPTTAKKGLKNPETGEVVSNYTNYAFTKRWIKQALVTEGLLDKIYKTNELNSEVDSVIKTAIAQLEQMDKYKP